MSQSKPGSKLVAAIIYHYDLINILFRFRHHISDIALGVKAGDSNDDFWSRLTTIHFTVTDFARLRGLSGSSPRAIAT